METTIVTTETTEVSPAPSVDPVTEAVQIAQVAEQETRAVVAEATADVAQAEAEARIAEAEARTAQAQSAPEVNEVRAWLERMEARQIAMESVLTDQSNRLQSLTTGLTEVVTVLASPPNPPNPSEPEVVVPVESEVPSPAGNEPLPVPPAPTRKRTGKDFLQ